MRVAGGTLPLTNDVIGCNLETPRAAGHLSQSIHPRDDAPRNTANFVADIQRANER